MTRAGEIVVGPDGPRVVTVRWGNLYAKAEHREARVVWTSADATFLRLVRGLSGDALETKYAEGDPLWVGVHAVLSEIPDAEIVGAFPAPVPSDPTIVY